MYVLCFRPEGTSATSLAAAAAIPSALDGVFSCNTVLLSLLSTS